MYNFYINSHCCGLNTIEIWFYCRYSFLIVVLLHYKILLCMLQPLSLHHLNWLRWCRNRGGFHYFPYSFSNFLAIIFKIITSVDLTTIIQDAENEQNQDISGPSIQEKATFERVPYLPRGWCIVFEPATQCFVCLIEHRVMIFSGNVTSKYLNWNANSIKSGLVVQVGHGIIT